MNYQDYPTFKGITPEAAAYLDRLDNVLQNNNISLDSQELLIRKIDLYYRYQEEAKKNNGKFAKNTETYLQAMGGEHGRVIFPFLVSSIYGQRRETKNDAPTSATEYTAMLNDWKQQNNGLKIIGGDNEGPTSWIYKTAPQNSIDKKAGKPMHRFILNVDPDKELLSKLDDFALKYGCQYKCAETQDIAYSRPDTIVIYTADTRFEEQKQELFGLVKQRTRKNGDNMLDGEKIADGLYTAPERNRQDIEQLIQQAQTVYPRLAENLQLILDNNPSKSHPLSLGEFTIYSDLLESFKQLQKQNSREQTHTNEQKSKLQTELQNGVDAYFYPGAKTELPEINQTDSASYKLNAKNPAIMEINGQDIDGKPTFSATYNKNTGYYTYQGGKPEKTYSNDPALNFPPLPEKALAALQKNQRDTLNQTRKDLEQENKQKKQFQEKLSNGVSNDFNGFLTELPEVKQTASAFYKLNAKNPAIMEINGQDIDGKPTFSVTYNKNTGYYTYQGGKPEKTYSNDPALNFPPLPEKALAALQKNQRDTMEKIRNPKAYQRKIEQKRLERLAARKREQEKEKQKYEQELSQFILNHQEEKLQEVHPKDNAKAAHPTSKQPAPTKKSWKERLKNLAQKTAYYGKELVKEVLLSPYLLAKEIYKLPDRLKPLPPKLNPKYNWRNDPQRMAQVSIRYNRMLNRQKTSPQPRKDLTQFIQNMRNGTNSNLQTKPTVVKKAPQQNFSLQLYERMAGHDRK